MSYNYLIKNGCIIDGSGSPWFKGDISVVNGRIEKIGRVEVGDKTIDASGLCVCPGFVDVHTHSDVTLIANPQAESAVRQGVTTHVVGNCGTSAAPLTEKYLEKMEEPSMILRAKRWGVEIDWRTFNEYLNRMEKEKVSINVVPLVGHGTVRQDVMGLEARKPTKDELDQMKKLLAESMEQGAFGMSVGLEYIPGRYSETEEIVECAKVISRYGGLYSSHSRQRDANAYLAIAEAAEIGERASVPVRVSHLAERYPAPDGGVERSLRVIEESRIKGVDISSDEELPPFLDGYGWSTGFLATELFRERLPEVTLETLRDPEKRKELFVFGTTTQYGPIYTLRGGVWNRVVLLTSKKHPELIGKNFEEIAEKMGRKRPIGSWTTEGYMEMYNAALDFLLEEGEDYWRKVYVRVGRSTERDKMRSVSHSAVCFASDSSSMAPYGALGKESQYQSPRSYVSYAQLFRMLREGRVDMTLEEMISKMSVHPAQRFRLFDRGLIRPGMWADLAVLDPERVTDKATHEEPTKYPEGIEYVFVNGRLVVDKGEHTGELPGKVLRWKP